MKIHPTFLPDRSRVWVKVLTWVFRILVGVVFVFSGIVKAIDPWGTFYKFQEYIAALSLPVWPDVLWVGVFLLCASEFLIGAFLLFGCFRRITPLAGFLFMVLMLPLTLWLAVANPIADCGCFGEAVIISNWETFWKNVVLTVSLIWLLIYNRSVTCLITPAIQWVAFLLSAAYILFVSFVGYAFQPLVDFRQYKIGTELIAEDNADDEPQYLFVYRRGEEEKRVKADDVQPDESEGWEFVDREEISAGKFNVETPVKALRLWSEDGGEDITDTIDFAEGKRLTIFVPDLPGLSILYAWPLNALKDRTDRQGVSLAVAINGSPEEIAVWKDLFMPSYEVFTAEDTSMEEAVRGNPGAVYTEDGKIVWKATLSYILNNIDLEDSGEIPVKDYVHYEGKLFYRLTGGYAAVMILLGISAPLILFFQRRRKEESSELTHDDTASRKE